MLFSSRLPLNALVTLCQAFRVGLSAGLSLVDVFRQQERKGPPAARPVIGRMAERLNSGDSLAETLKDENRYFPPLFVGMAVVGELTGNLAEVFHELENYYRHVAQLRRDFIAMSFWPVFQFCGAIFVLSLLIIILGWIAQNPETAWDPLGFGVGPPGVIRFLGSIAVLIGGIAGVYLLVTRVLGKKAAVHRLLLSVPVIGPCWQAMSLARFCVGLHLTMDTSLPAPKALRLSLAATGNGAYEACADSLAAAVKKGGEISAALTDCRIFPEDFVNIVATAEESGQLPEVMGRQAEHYQEESRLKMKILTMFAGFAVWGFVALIIIIFIARMVMAYANLLGGAMKDAGV